MNQKQIGDFIRKKRLEQRLTQTQLAENLGVTQRTVSRWENGAYMPDLSLINSLSMELHVSVGELLAGEEKSLGETEPGQQIKSLVSYAEQEKLNTIRKWKRILTIILIIMFVLFIDLSIGYFSTSMHWIINGREFQSQGLFFGLIFGREKQGNFEGNYLSKMFWIYMFFFVWLILMVIAVLLLNLMESRVMNKQNNGQ